MSNSENYKSCRKFARYAIQENNEKVKNAIIAIITNDEDFLNKMYNNVTDFVAKKLYEDTNDTNPNDIISAAIKEYKFKKCLLDSISTGIEDMVNKTDYDNLKKTLEDKLHESESKVSNLNYELFNAKAYQSKLESQVKDLENEKESEKERADTAELNLKNRNEEINNIINDYKKEIAEINKNHNNINEKESVETICEESKDVSEEPETFVEPVVNTKNMKAFLQNIMYSRKTKSDDYSDQKIYPGFVVSNWLKDFDDAEKEEIMNAAFEYKILIKNKNNTYTFNSEQFDTVFNKFSSC